MTRNKQKTQDARGDVSGIAAEIAAEPWSAPSGTAVVAEAMQTGVVPLATARLSDNKNRGDSRLQTGDVETNAVDNASAMARNRRIGRYPAATSAKGGDSRG